MKTTKKTPSIVTHADALSFGFPRYFTGLPCKRGHVCERISANKTCVECRVINRHDSSETTRAYNKKYYAKNKSNYAERASKYVSENLAAYRIRNQKRRARKLNATPSWFGELDELVMLEAADLARRRELSTGLAWQVDHAIPLQARKACGLHCAANVQVIPATLNASKQNKMIFTEPGEWLRAL